MLRYILTNFSWHQPTDTSKSLEKFIYSIFGSHSSLSDDRNSVSLRVNDKSIFSHILKQFLMIRLILYVTKANENAYIFTVRGLHFRWFFHCLRFKFNTRGF